MRLIYTCTSDSGCFWCTIMWICTAHTLMYIGYVSTQTLSRFPLVSLQLYIVHVHVRNGRVPLPSHAFTNVYTLFTVVSSYSGDLCFFSTAITTPFFAMVEGLEDNHAIDRSNWCAPLIPTDNAPAATACRAYSIWTSFPDGLLGSDMEKNERHNEGPTRYCEQHATRAMNHLLQRHRALQSQKQLYLNVVKLKL